MPAVCGARSAVCPWQTEMADMDLQWFRYTTWQLTGPAPRERPIVWADTRGVIQTRWVSTCAQRAAYHPGQRPPAFNSRLQIAITPCHQLDHPARIVRSEVEACENIRLISSSIDSRDILQRPSSCDSSSSMEPTKMRAEGSHSHDNNNNEIEKIELFQLTTLTTILADVLENIYAQMQNYIVSIQLTANNAENEKVMKALLGSYYTMVEKLFVITGGIFLSYAYFLAQKPQGSVEEIWMVIFIGSFIASLSNAILLIHAYYLKEIGSIEACEPGILKWLLLLVLAFLYAVFCILLQAFAKTTHLVLWLLGIIGICSIVLGWVWFFYRKWPKFLEEIKAGHCVGENGMSQSNSDGPSGICTIEMS